ncbi:MAG: glycoside hydrolase family 3 N-terminal domain-containing protein [Propionibacteriaceae bacterium]
MSASDDHAATIREMTLAEKASLCSGLDFWRTQPVDRVGIGSRWLSDGPHGLRNQAKEADHLAIEASEPATCFPPAAALASSWDRDLARRVGAAIATEARTQGVSVVLGPGVNIKRSPLCGRNFEYLSEDPVLAGELAVAYVRGVQQHGVGTSLKHFAANNQRRIGCGCRPRWTSAPCARSTCPPSNG